LGHSSPAAPTAAPETYAPYKSLLGHESIATTQRYTAVDDGELRAAMAAALDDAI
jgi:site-specific recombinase XerC